MLESSRPRHEQISDWLRAEIIERRYVPHAKLPSESQLGTQFDVSRITVRRALQTIENEGLIYRRQGLGSFVQPPRVRQGLVRLTDFVEDMQQAGLAPSSKVLGRTLVQAPEAVAAAFEFEDPKPVLRLDRLRMGDGAPIALDQTWLPFFYAQLLEGHDLARETIYHILERDYEIPVLRGRFRIEAVNAEPAIAAYLEVPPQQALLCIERISYTTGERPVYFQRRFYRSDRVAYELELKRSADQDGADPLGMPLHGFEPVFKG